VTNIVRHRRWLFLLLAGVLGGLAVPAGGNEAKKAVTKGRQFAVVVGVRHYKKSELRPLKYAEKDAAALADALRGAGYRRVVLLTYEAAAEDGDALPTARNIREQLASMAEDCDPDDTLVFAFTGHGAQIEGDKEHYLCPINAELTKKDTLVALSAVYKELAKCKAKTRLAIIDTCRPGPQMGASVRLEIKPRPQEIEVPKGVVVLFGCSAGQFSLESERLGQGLFFHYLLKGLGGDAAPKGGAITLDALVKYVQDEVPDAAKDDGGPSARQVPLVRGEPPARLVVLPEPSGFIVAKGKEIVNSIGMKLVGIPKGKFMRGSPFGEPLRQPDEGPVREVEIKKPFLMGAYEVTQAQYQKVMGHNPSSFRPGGSSGNRVIGMDTNFHPVETVTWHDAVDFCKKLSALPAEKAARRVYRLPTEAEWEYACRAGTNTAFSFGASASSRQANFDGDFPYNGGARGPDLVRTTRVGSYPPNAWGLYDMHGNVAEWCSDFYGAGYYGASPARDPHGPANGFQRVLRGGAWTNMGRECRAARRLYQAPQARNATHGIRVVCVPAGVR
jgi:formylglycine-generating enzyme required for sulfatase activity